LFESERTDFPPFDLTDPAGLSRFTDFAKPSRIASRGTPDLSGSRRIWRPETSNLVRTKRLAVFVLDCVKRFLACARLPMVFRRLIVALSRRIRFLRGAQNRFKKGEIIS
jgi:hypothetical protein